MEIKVVEEIVRTKKVNKYVAFDGTEFDNSWKCRIYEHDLCQKMIAERDDIIFDTEIHGVIPIDCRWDYDDGEYEWYKPLTEEAIKFLNKMFDLDDCNKLDERSIGEWICFEKDSDDDYFAYDFGSSKITAEEFFKCFGYKMILEEIKEEE